MTYVVTLTKGSFVLFFYLFMYIPLTYCTKGTKSINSLYTLLCVV